MLFLTGCSRTVGLVCCFRFKFFGISNFFSPMRSNTPSRSASWRVERSGIADRAAISLTVRARAAVLGKSVACSNFWPEASAVQLHEVDGLLLGQNNVPRGLVRAQRYAGRHGGMHSAQQIAGRRPRRSHPIGFRH